MLCDIILYSLYDYTNAKNILTLLIWRKKKCGDMWEKKKIITLIRNVVVLQLRRDTIFFSFMEKSYCKIV